MNLTDLLCRGAKEHDHRINLPRRPTGPGYRNVTVRRHRSPCVDKLKFDDEPVDTALRFLRYFIFSGYDVDVLREDEIYG